MKKTVVLLMLTMLFSLPMAEGAVPADGATMLIRAEYDRQPIPLLTQTYPGLTAESAYQVQKAYIGMKLAGGDKIAGFKGGLTAAGVQKRFGMKAPVTGVLLESGKLTGNPVLERSRYGALMLESEVAFIIGEPIRETVMDVASLRPKIRALLPSIEVPDLGVTDMKQLKASDLIACNVSARQFILGQPVDPDSVDPNEVQMTLYHNGMAISSGSGADALGDQWNAALWLVNSMLEQGYTIEPGQVLMTGALGAMLPGKPGNYVAEFGSIGRIQFEVR
ncbi:MAG: 2-keto-4-pentenoate hydratase [Negativicutes bacterium]